MVSKTSQNKMKKENKPRHENHYQPPCFNDFPYFNHDPCDRRAPLLVVHALIVAGQSIIQ
jgi:hypothetical protein